MKDDRYLVKCLMVSRYVVSEKFIVDTGAKYTCCNYRAVDKSLRDIQFSDQEVKYLGGLVKGEIVRFYRFQLRQFTIGNIDMGCQNIWITFDGRVTDIILGMDLLKQIVCLMNPYTGKIYFWRDINEYQKSAGSVENHELL